MKLIDRRSRRAAVAAAAVAALAVAVWFALDRLNRRADWLAVEAPVYAAAGKPLPLKITVKKADVPTYLVVNLNWTDRDRLSGGFLAHGGDRFLVASGGSFLFTPEVRPRDNLAFVFAVVYLSPTGEWSARDRAASTDLIRVKAQSGSAADARMRALPAYAGDTRPASAAPPWNEADRSWAGTAVAGLLLAAAVAAAAAAAGSAGAAARRERTAWAAVAVAFAAATVWELSGAGRAVTQLGRAFAAAHHWYYLRKPLQAAVIAALTGAGAGAAVLASRAARSLDPALAIALVGALLYAVITAVDLLSFHATDAIAGVSVSGLPLIQALKLACAAAVLAAAAPRALSRRPRSLRR